MADFEMSEEPNDKITRICAAMTLALVCSEESNGEERAIIFINEGGRGGFVIHGYENENGDQEAVKDFLQHAQGFFESMGVDLRMFPLNRPDRPDKLGEQ